MHAEHSILVNSDFKSVRLDIYVSDEMQVNYNLEAQNEKERESKGTLWLKKVPNYKRRF